VTHISKLIDHTGQHVGYAHTIVDKTDVKQKDKQIRVKDERFRLTKSLYDCGIWEYDAIEKSLRRDTGSNDGFPIPDITYNMPESFINEGMVHARSIEDFRNIFQLLDAGEPYIESEIALYFGVKKEVKWYRMACTNVFDDTGNLLKAICITQNITKQKEDVLKAEKERRDLMDEINRDPLTGLFNRKHMVEKIEIYLKSRPVNTSGGLMLVDVDEFRFINEFFGHQKADEFLKKTAGIMRDLFLESDWLCRTSADEFMVFVNSGNEIEIQDKAQQLCRLVSLLGKDYSDDRFGEKAIGTSIGIATFAKERVDFDELNRNADKALFAAKSKGKNDSVVYGHFP
jgi:diguanylate cyclase (GGDEF)-like protein